MIRKGLEGKSHRLRAIQEIFEEGYVKKKTKKKKRKKKEWNGRRMPINSKRGKRGFN
jgi:predicted ribosome quality control (RQC) complex YloA/Tae2 family protein